jgi:hypothetical protein
MFFACDSDANRVLVREAVLLQMTGAAGALPVDRYPLVLEQAASKLHFGFMNGVVPGNR